MKNITGFACYVNAAMQMIIHCFPSFYKNIDEKKFPEEYSAAERFMKTVEKTKNAEKPLSKDDKEEIEKIITSLYEKIFIDLGDGNSHSDSREVQKKIENKSSSGKYIFPVLISYKEDGKKIYNLKHSKYKLEGNDDYTGKLLEQDSLGNQKGHLDWLVPIISEELLQGSSIPTKVELKKLIKRETREQEIKDRKINLKYLLEPYGLEADGKNEPEIVIALKKYLLLKSYQEFSKLVEQLRGDFIGLSDNEKKRQVLSSLPTAYLNKENIKSTSDIDLKKLDAYRNDIGEEIKTILSREVKVPDGGNIYNVEDLEPFEKEVIDQFKNAGFDGENIKKQLNNNAFVLGNEDYNHTVEMQYQFFKRIYPVVKEPQLIISLKREMFYRAEGTTKRLNTRVEGVMKVRLSKNEVEFEFPTSSDEVEFDLEVAILQTGSASRGHYWAYRKIEENGKKRWIKCDDSRVSYAEEEEVRKDVEENCVQLVYRTKEGKAKKKS